MLFFATDLDLGDLSVEWGGLSGGVPGMVRMPFSLLGDLTLNKNMFSGKTRGIVLADLFGIARGPVAKDLESILNR